MMPSTFAKFSVVPAALAVLIFAAPAFAQSQPTSGTDPFSGVPAVDADKMSAVGGELAGGLRIGTSTRVETSDCGAGASCGGGVPGNAVGATTRDVSASGNTYSVNVTAINIQTTITGPGVINTGGGLNAAGGGGASAGN